VSDSGDRDKRPGGQRPGGSSAGNDGGRRDSGRPPRGEPSNARPPRPSREGDAPRGERPRRDGDAPRSDRPRRDGDAPRGGRPDRPDRPRRDSDGRPPRPAGAGGRDGGSRDGRGAPRDGERRLWTASGAPARGNWDASERETPEDRDPFGTRSVRAHHDDPIIPEGVEASELDRVARNELKTLSKENADGVALHLVMAARLIEENPKEAHQHAISAARRAGRIGVVRETLAITAYAVGDYALALRELRTHRRITGSNDQLPMMVDSERGMGRPEKALELGRSVQRSTLPVPVQVELAIAMSGARYDLGQVEAALSELEIAQLDPKKAFSYSPALFDAYAGVLEELGRADEAQEWFDRSDRASELLELAGDPDGGDTIEIVEEDLPYEEYVDAPADDEATDDDELVSKEEPDGTVPEEKPADESSDER